MGRRIKKQAEEKTERKGKKTVAKGKKSGDSPGWAVVTGATSGIGLEFVRRLAGKGYSILMVARRKNRLLSLQRKLDQAGVECDIMIADLTSASGMDLVTDWLKDHPVEIVINNAGFGLAGCFLETDGTREQEMIDLNISAMHRLFKTAVLEMQKRNRGYILNVASSAGLIPGGPYMATYYATKAYVVSLTTGVAEELRGMGSGVYVGCLCPGPVDTEFNRVANVQFALKGITPKKAVGAALSGMARGKTVIVPTLTMKAAVTGAKLLPRRTAAKLAAGQQKKKLGA